MAEYGLQHRDYYEAHVIRNFFQFYNIKNKYIQGSEDQFKNILKLLTANKARQYVISI
jgi:hypothetical protein